MSYQLANLEKVDTQRRTPLEVLQLQDEYLAGFGIYYGWAPSQGRRCRNPLKQLKRAGVKRLLERLAQPNLSDNDVKTILIALSKNLLCKHNHDDSKRRNVSQVKTIAKVFETKLRLEHERVEEAKRLLDLQEARVKAERDRAARTAERILREQKHELERQIAARDEFILMWIDRQIEAEQEQEEKEQEQEEKEQEQEEKEQEQEEKEQEQEDEDDETEQEEADEYRPSSPTSSLLPPYSPVNRQFSHQPAVPNPSHASTVFTDSTASASPGTSTTPTSATISSNTVSGCVARKSPADGCKISFRNVEDPADKVNCGHRCGSDLHVVCKAEQRKGYITVSNEGESRSNPTDTESEGDEHPRQLFCVTCPRCGCERREEEGVRGEHLERCEDEAEDEEPVEGEKPVGEKDAEDDEDSAEEEMKEVESRWFPSASGLLNLGRGFWGFAWLISVRKRGSRYIV